MTLTLPSLQDGLTPMHCAARSGHNQVVECLLKRGSKVDMKTLNGLTPLHMAIQGDHEACTKLLLAHKSDINETTVVSASVFLWILVFVE